MSDFCPSDSELAMLALASPFAFGIYQKQPSQVGAFLGRFGLACPLDRAVFDGLIREFVAICAGISGAEDDIKENDVTEKDVKGSDVKDGINKDDIKSGTEQTTDKTGDVEHADMRYDEIDESAVMQAMRELRAMLMVKWIWQDALGVISLERLTTELSDFADACVCFAKDYAWHKTAERYGVPMTSSVQLAQTGMGGMGKKSPKIMPDEFAVIAMGKLGARELNLSSDIDLIFVYLGAGDTDISEQGKKSVENQKFMTTLGRVLIRLLNDHSEHGFVFRVDMRLRPWGDGSPLIMSLSALEKYFNQHGRTWERFAWLKARVVNPVSTPFADELSAVMKNFVYRYYIDYTAFSALREMKTLIMAQQAQRQDTDNVKLGVGGIRDIEFIAQAFSLIYGGHHLALGERSACLDVLSMLGELDYLDDDECTKLMDAYRFLRRLEHAIQARHDEQTQRLPMGDELVAIAQVLGFESVMDFQAVLARHRQNVFAPFNRMVTDRQSPTQSLGETAEMERALQGLLSADSLHLLDEFWQSKLVASLEPDAKARLDGAYPILLHALCHHAKSDGAERADDAVPRLITLLESICRRSIYLVMIAENPNATMGLIPMLSASPWIARELALHPMLLDDFLQQRYLHLPDKAELTDILRQQLLRVLPFDDEQYLTAIRTFKKSQVLAVATADILGLRHIMKVSDSLTFIAEVVLSSALSRAYDELVAKHGHPVRADGMPTDETACGFAIIGYGKLGGIEMSYASDLDVVFLHDIDEKADTVGDNVKVISGMKFASRLVQKVITYLTTQTRDGRAYELDIRLRPSGNAGVMVVSVQGFDSYQRDKAWAWEHQALVRARGIAGDKAVLDAFDNTRHQVLTAHRESEQVRQDVLSMRQKMKEHLGTKSSNQPNNHGLVQPFHIKQDFGGLIDIEFLAQFMVLAHAHAHPSLAIWSDNVRIFEEVVQTELWSADWCDRLTQAYLALRKTTHELALSEKQVVVDDDNWQAIRAFVCGVWGEVIGE